MVKGSFLTGQRRLTLTCTRPRIARLSSARLTRSGVDCAAGDAGASGVFVLNRCV
jgi:hypothetical protein